MTQGPPGSLAWVPVVDVGYGKEWEAFLGLGRACLWHGTPCIMTEHGPGSWADP